MFNIEKTVFLILKSTLANSLKEHGYELSPDTWNLPKEPSLSEYIYFNNEGFLAIFPNCKKGNYTLDKRYTGVSFKFRTRMPEDVVDDVVNKINSLFVDSGPLTSGNQIAKEAKKARLVDILSEHKAMDIAEINSVVESIFDTLEGCEETLQVQIFDERGMSLKTAMTDYAFGNLKSMVMKGNPNVKKVSVDLADRPELLNKLLKGRPSEIRAVIAELS